IHVGLSACDDVGDHGRVLHDAERAGRPLRSGHPCFLARSPRRADIAELIYFFVNSAGSKTYSFEQNSQLTRMTPSFVLSSISSAVNPSRIALIFSREQEQSSITSTPS